MTSGPPEKSFSILSALGWIGKFLTGLFAVFVFICFGIPLLIVASQLIGLGVAAVLGHAGALLVVALRSLSTNTYEESINAFRQRAATKFEAALWTPCATAVFIALLCIFVILPYKRALAKALLTARIFYYTHVLSSHGLTEQAYFEARNAQELDFSRKRDSLKRRHEYQKTTTVYICHLKDSLEAIEAEERKEQEHKDASLKGALSGVTPANFTMCTEPAPMPSSAALASLPVSTSQNTELVDGHASSIEHRCTETPCSECMGVQIPYAAALPPSVVYSDQPVAYTPSYWAQVTTETEEDCMKILALVSKIAELGSQSTANAKTGHELVAAQRELCATKQRVDARRNLHLQFAKKNGERNFQHQAAL